MVGIRTVYSLDPSTSLNIIFPSLSEEHITKNDPTVLLHQAAIKRTHDHVAQFKNQEVSEWGDLTMRDLPMTTFIGDKPITTGKYESRYRSGYAMLVDDLCKSLAVVRRDISARTIRTCGFTLRQNRLHS